MPGRESEPTDISAQLAGFLKLFPPEGASVSFSNRQWERLWYQGQPLREYLFSGLYKDFPRATQESQWEGFKAQCATRGNWLPWLIFCIEPQPQFTGLFKRGRPRRPKGSNIFDDLPPAQQAEAQKIFKRLCDDWLWRAREGTARFDKSNWRKPLLAGAARRLSQNPQNRSSEWGKRMRRIKGGKHAQRRYRERGWHPLPSVRKAWGLTGEAPTNPPAPN